jgi:hemolysin activation/secretion protein/AraC-like DNA-binding protein
LLLPDCDTSETHRTQSIGILSRSMTVERHLTLQELTLRPGGEWTPQHRGWLVARVAEGVGYWMQNGNVRELNVGDGFVAGFSANLVLRSSQLGALKLQFFSVLPQHLNGVLTVAEAHQLEGAPDNRLPQVSIFSAAEPIGQKFSRLAESAHVDGLPARCALLQLWVSALTGVMTSPVSESGGNKLHERFRQIVGKMTEAELSETSLADIARQLHCSERHFSRLFREEFGVPFRARQIELRLQRAQQLLAGSDSKIINVAYESGYRHLGLFNAMFKKRFGVTPGEWRQQNAPKNSPPQSRNIFSKTTSAIAVLLLMAGIFFSPPVFAQTNSADTEAMAKARAALLQKMAEPDAPEKNARIHWVPASTNAGPRFKVERFYVAGNSLLTPGAVGDVITNVPDAFGTNVSFEDIQAALGDLQMAYRERGFVTVSVVLPPQKLTNATVKVQVTEAPLVAINVTGNRYFSTENILRALPSLHTNMMLNSHVFQRELDLANASRDRQIYPVIGPGPEPRTSALTLKVKDTLPLHARVELNNDNTPGTPALRVNTTAQYDNLWDLNHQIGVQYSFSPEQFKGLDNYNTTPFDDPLVANYSAYYRMPLANANSVQRQVEANPSSFGYNEVTHQFNLPPPTDQPTLTFFASRATTDSGVQLGKLTPVVSTPLLTIDSQNSGENISLNDGLGASLSLPLPQIANVSSTLTFGLNFKHYQVTSYNTNNFISSFTFTNGNLGPTTSVTRVSSPQPKHVTTLDYIPFNVGFNGSVPDAMGTTYFNTTVNFNPLNVFSGNGEFSRASYSTNSRAHYVTVVMGADRVQTIYKDWSVKLHADGQWANAPLFSNEQYAMGGLASVRGYQNGEGYGDNGWRATIEPQTPQIKIGMAGNDGSEAPVWVRASVFTDYGQIYRIDSFPNGANSVNYWGAGFGVTANIGNHLDARLTVAWPLLTDPLLSPAGKSTAAGNIHVYFALGAQF